MKIKHHIVKLKSPLLASTGNRDQQDIHIVAKTEHW